MKRARIRAGTFLVVATLLQACGGGGGNDDSSGPPPGPNRDPIAELQIPDQVLITQHPFQFDVSQEGRTFVDPDGDPLDYEIWFTPVTPAGLSTNGPIISGTPRRSGSFTAHIHVQDGQGGENFAEVGLDVTANHRPSLRISNSDQILTASDVVDVDVIHGGQAFVDADGDPLTYEVSFAASGHGLSIAGTRVFGTMTSIGLAHVVVTASDGYGGTAEDTFSLARPAAEPGEPTLPTPPYVYDDAELNLPIDMVISREHTIPFPDTTPSHNPTTNAGAALGRVLFYDKRLSITNTVSCGSCHHQSRGFAAPERFSSGALGPQQTRNAMSLGNVRYNETNSFFWDNRVFTLETLARQPIENPMELGQSMDMLAAKLTATPFYPPLFEAAFGTPEITPKRIARALTQFLRSLLSYRSRFDEALLHRDPGEVPDPAEVFDAQELRGLQVATDSNCFACHDEVILIVNFTRNNGLDQEFTDPGSDNGRFRPPSLRNVRASAPYMHDGRFATLRDVINHYDHGVQDSPRLDDVLRIDGNNGPPRRLNLSEEDKDALEALLDTLTDEAFLTDPRFSDPFGPD